MVIFIYGYNQIFRCRLLHSLHLHAVDISFEEIIESLTQISEQLIDKETIHQAICLKRKLLSFEVLLLLLFMVNVTSVTHALTAHLQGEELDIVTAIDVISNTMNLLQHMGNDDNTTINMIEVGLTIIDI